MPAAPAPFGAPLPAPPEGELVPPEGELVPPEAELVLPEAELAPPEFAPAWPGPPPLGGPPASFSVVFGSGSPVQPRAATSNDSAPSQPCFHIASR
jgi:hypothetical protein